MSTPRKQSVILNGIKYPLVYLTSASYKELYDKVFKYTQAITMKSQGHDPDDPYKVIHLEIKGFVFNNFRIRSETSESFRVFQQCGRIRF
jgi:hypothetical protein